MYQMFHFLTRTVLRHISYNQPMSCPCNICMQVTEGVIIKVVTPHRRKIHIHGNTFQITYSPKGCRVLQDRGCNDLMNLYKSGACNEHESRGVNLNLNVRLPPSIRGAKLRIHPGCWPRPNLFWRHNHRRKMDHKWPDLGRCDTNSPG